MNAPSTVAEVLAFDEWTDEQKRIARAGVGREMESLTPPVQMKGVVNVDLARQSLQDAENAISEVEWAISDAWRALGGRR